METDLYKLLKTQVGMVLPYKETFAIDQMYLKPNVLISGY